MKSFKLPQKPSIYRDILPTTYSYDEKNGDLTCGRHYIVKDVGLNEWGMLQRCHRLGHYGDIADILVMIQHDKETEYLF